MMRKVITTTLATLISVLVLLLGGGFNLDLIGTAIFTIIVIFPIIFVYGLPVTFLSDYLTRKLTGTRRSLTALGVHLLFGLLFAPLYALVIEHSSFTMLLSLLGAATVAVSFWAIDEVLRRINGENDVIHHQESKIKIGIWAYSFIFLLMTLFLAFTTGTIMEAKKAYELNMDSILTYNLLYSLGLALLLSPVGYLGAKMVYDRKIVKE
ncbi:hypothetical protein [Thalassobacillus hwangdonensis]|uniref:Uncharacterized protein n=1 Tax=Thalassobacillus hwangdonensis TaxID=546108 RepID=A0ABW3L2S2_9BACI